MAILIHTPEKRICGEQPCWLPENEYKTNGRCAFTGCLLPYTWQCRREECPTAAAEEAQMRRYPNEVHAIVIDREGRRHRYNTLQSLANAYDVNINYVRYHKGKGLIKKGGMEGCKIF